ncbi:DNA (cytosine-5-)-methyltransferase [Geminocystis herdmanii]|uniref:DNA (cytosine-5-)-methyltransferase n=1 Tax=Geminocystis herdmanii TaxID=669359 RepID=UPI0003464C5C|nr:DNA (cytosine-5-)-methyltransferase [Geminocystis herdmanii]
MDTIDIKTSIDLFAGIGGFRIALENNGFNCIYSNDYNKYSCQTYSANFGEIYCGDLKDIVASNIPNFDLLCGGFPCQPFSIAGVSKKKSLGKKHGFEDEKQGNLFFKILRIIDFHQPKIIFLENVKNLKSHDKGNTWQVIKNELLIRNYEIFSEIVDGKYYVPQHRERIFIVCFNKNIFPNINFEFPSLPIKRLYELKDILEKNVDDKYTLSDKLWNYLQQHKKNSQAKGNGFGFGIINMESEYTRTLSARYYKDGSEILVEQINKNPRRLTPRECAKLLGFPDDFIIPVSDAQAYRQFGNSVIVPVVDAILKQIKITVEKYNLGQSRQKQLSLF